MAVNNNESFVHPNPGTDIISVDIADFAKQTQKLTIKMYNGSGYLTTKLVAAENNIFNYDISDMSQGTYIIEVIDEVNNLRKQTKLIVIR